jgi:hypothetical protein
VGILTGCVDLSEYSQTTSMAAARALGAGSRDRDGCRAGSHAVAGAKHAMPTGKARQAATARRARTPGDSRLGRALSVTRRPLFHTGPNRFPELSGGLVDPDPPVWQVMIRAAQTPAFGVAVIIGVIFAGFAAATPPLLAHGPATHPAHRLSPHNVPRLMPRGPTTAVKLGPSAYPVPPIGNVQLENPDRLGHNPTPTNDDGVPKDSPDPKAPIANPDLDAALNELDQQADRDEAWASQHPAPPGPAHLCPPICTDAPSPPPEQVPAPAGLGPKG